MDTKEAEFLKRLQATFRVEAEEHIRAISAGLLELEKTKEPARRAARIETIFREAHSLKGAARAVNLRDVESICQQLESAFAALKSREIALSPALSELFDRAVNHLAHLVSTAEAERTTADRNLTRDLIRQLQEACTSAETPAVEVDSFEQAPLAPPPPPGEMPMPMETVRVPTSLLDPLLLQAEEMIMAKLAAGQRCAELKEINQTLLSWKKESAKWKDRLSADSAPAWAEWLEWNEIRLNAASDSTAAMTRALEQDRRTLRRMVDDHLEAMKIILMLPVATMVEALPKFVRDLAREQGKEADLVVRGAESEIDKRILEELKDPLIHLLRNCVDHGMQTPDERAKRNKPTRGIITLAFEAKESRQVEIIVSDDGAGMDPDKLRSAAVKAGAVSKDAAGKLDPQETFSLAFLSGVSTSPFITDISGRGLGLAIVREKVEKLGGTVSLASRPQGGTTFSLLLPMTLATFRGVLVRVGEQSFVLPTINVKRAIRVRPDEVKTVENRETIDLDGEIISMVRLGEVLGLPTRGPGSRPTPTTDYFPAVVLESADKRIAFQVDEVLGERQVLVKGLGKQLDRVRNVAGGTVLGTGKVVPVLNAADLVKSAVRSAAAVKTVEAVAEAPELAGRILVAEDSITARTLIKNILETAGYSVMTAVDGMDALTQLRSGEFDLVVSDVDMPRMSGFELTARIREDRKLGELPVVLVTALESREDRERGIEVGANAYIVKSSFDQSNLLEAVGRMI